jgi:hypothetical protein
MSAPPKPVGPGVNPNKDDALHQNATLMVLATIGGTPISGATTWNLDPTQGPVDPAVAQRLNAAVALHKDFYAWLRGAQTDPTWDPTPTPAPPPAVSAVSAAVLAAGS